MLTLFLVIMENQTVYPLYAENEQDARGMTQTWIETTCHQKRAYTLLPCPQGHPVRGSHSFENVLLPGTLPISGKARLSLRWGAEDHPLSS
jgi:hypothetical protein